ncbi:MAG: 2-hydroxychromene-2-carboxylate isomerase [Alphaproteobacteria bacterium]|nr:2-hydroxychromene-2-carboxylate isomerase [Alphaproteobacteria bacterium]
MNASSSGKTLDFYFDFSSPYGYFASMRVDELAEEGGRRAVWRPILLGVVFKETGMAPLADIPLKGKYSLYDWERMGRMMRIPYRFPSRFPIPTQVAARAFYWIDDRDSDQARLFAKAAYHAYFAENVDISDPGKVLDIAATLHVDRTQLDQAMNSPEIKERLRLENANAIKRGVFGSPFFFVGNEPFWGSDRMWMVKRWMKGQDW